MSILAGHTHGFYVDVGAHHPFRYSNTAALYRLGWTGLDIDPTPGIGVLFGRSRPRSVALEVAVGTRPGPLTLFAFEEGAVNTLSPEWAEMQQVRFGRSPVRSVEVAVRTLASILNDYVAPGREIDLLSVDVEGRDLDALESNDWTRFRPRFVMVEAFDFLELHRVNEAEVCRYMVDRGYSAIAATPTTVVFKRDDITWSRL